MKKLDLNFQVQSLEGKNLDNAARILAQALVSQPSGNPIKLYDWAQSLWKSGVIEVDDADIQTLESFVKDSKFLYVLSKGPILKALLSCRDQ